MTLEQIIDYLKNDPDIKGNISKWKTYPAKEAIYAPFPEILEPLLIETLRQKGIENLYSHQAEACNNILAGYDTVVVTPTASGKTLCYNLPVIDKVLKNNDSRALYLFPTKALAQDQLSELHSFIQMLDVDIKTYTFDGDTPQTARRAIRSAGHIVISNPDMLHVGILPHHTKWIKLFENLEYVVIDEIHHYRGVFGSHLSNVIKRLKRICDFYGSSPTFICCSATIANPGELTERIIGKPIKVVNNNGAPSGERHFVLYNPPVINKELGIRRSAVKEAASLASNIMRNKIQTIVFAHYRLYVEVILTYLQRELKGKFGQGINVSSVQGQLPNALVIHQRRELGVLGI